MAKKKVKVKSKKKKKTTSTGYFRQTIPKQQASGWAGIGQFKQPEPPKLKPIGTYIPEFRTAWSNSARVRQEPVISKSWIKQQQEKAQSNTTMDKQNLKEALGMGTWAANITSWMDKQEKQINTLSDINKKRKGKKRGFRQPVHANDLSSSSERWSDAVAGGGAASDVGAYQVNEHGEMRGGPGTSEGESSQAGRDRQNVQDEIDRQEQEQRNRQNVQDEIDRREASDHRAMDELERDADENKYPGQDGYEVPGEWNEEGDEVEEEEKSDEDDEQLDEEEEVAAAIAAGGRSGGGAGLEAGKGAGLGSEFPTLTDNGKYHCYCNSKIANTSASVGQHKKGIKHRKYVRDELGEDPDTYDQGNALAAPRGRPRAGGSTRDG